MSAQVYASGMVIDGKIPAQAVPPGDYENQPFEGTVDINLHFPKVVNKDTGLMVVLHGWGGTYHQYDSWCNHWCDQFNVVTLQVNYRHSGDSKPVYDFGKYQAIDVLRAMNYVLRHYKLNEKRIIGWGGSGGGNVILQTAKMAPNTFALVIDCAGITRPTDPSDRERGYDEGKRTGGWQQTALGPGKKYSRPEWQIRDAQYHAKYFNTKVYIFHGDNDPVVVVQHGIDMAEALRKAGKEVVLKVIKGGDHFFRGAADPTENTRKKATEKYAGEDIMKRRLKGKTDFERHSVIDLPVDGGIIYRVTYDKEGWASLTRIDPKH